MIFDILTLFPGMFVSPLRESILGKARERGLIRVRVHNIRDYATDKHQITDDRPFGGGEGMVMKPEPIVKSSGCAQGGGTATLGRFAQPPGAHFPAGMRLEMERIASPGLDLRAV